MIRGKQPEADLKLTYNKVLWSALGGSLVLHLLIFVVFPNFEADALRQTPTGRHHPAGRNPRNQTGTAAAAAAPRPVVPIATDNPDIADDVTIETTDLDLDLDDLAPPPPLAELAGRSSGARRGRRRSRRVVAA